VRLQSFINILHIVMDGYGPLLTKLRVCLFGLWLAGCAGKAAVKEKLLF
jgi:hypothetical protein